jgi:hypothetical protein
MTTVVWLFVFLTGFLMTVCSDLLFVASNSSSECWPVQLERQQGKVNSAYLVASSAEKDLSVVDAGE